MNSLTFGKSTVRGNNVVKKIIGVTIVIVFLILVVFAGVQLNRVSALSRSLEQYRTDLELARRANDRYANTFREATKANTELGECLSKHVSTLSELRIQLAEVRTRYYQMQTILANLADSGDHLDGDNSISGGSGSNGGN